jgi:hypothetical protein
VPAVTRCRASPGGGGEESGFRGELAAAGGWETRAVEDLITFALIAAFRTARPGAAGGKGGADDAERAGVGVTLRYAQGEYSFQFLALAPATRPETGWP